MPFELPSLALPLWSLLVFYGLFLVFFVLYTGFNLYHLLRFGTYGIGLYGVTAFFLGGTVLLLAVSFFLLLPYDWSYSMSLGEFFERFKNDQFFPGF